ncbi:hypothetical protein BA78_8084 [Aspergillus fumigatus]|nr:hypothetical protein BA78_8084 [Aspergillus fumigatus]
MKDGRHRLLTPSTVSKTTTMTRTIHIAVLDVDIPPRSLYETHGLCSAHFRHALQDAATRFNALTPGSDIRIAVTPYDIRGGHYPDFRHLRKTQTPLSEHSIDAILITGGAPGVYEIDKRPWMQTLAKFLQTVFREYPAVRIMGTCFGHQLIGHALVDSRGGGRVCGEMSTGEGSGHPHSPAESGLCRCVSPCSGPSAERTIEDSDVPRRSGDGQRGHRGRLAGDRRGLAARAVGEYREHASLSDPGNVLPRPGAVGARTLRAGRVRDAEYVS